MTSQEAFTKAQRTARRKYNQVVWRDKAGNWHVERVTYQSIKQAMLSTGTQSKFYVRDRHFFHNATWGIAAMWLRNLKYGHYVHG